MNEHEMKQRTKKFALRILDLADALPHSRSGNVIAGQIVRSGTSVAANYRALCRAKSRADFVNKTSIVEEEADESSYWIELLIDAGIVKRERIDLLQESDEIVSIVVSSIKTARTDSTKPVLKSAIRIPQSEII